MKLYAINENHLFSKVYTKGKRAVTRTVCVYVLPDYHASRLQRAHPLKLRINRVGLTVTKTFKPFEIKTYTLRGSYLEETDILEGAVPLKK